MYETMKSVVNVLEDMKRDNEDMKRENEVLKSLVLKSEREREQERESIGSRSVDIIPSPNFSSSCNPSPITYPHRFDNTLESQEVPRKVPNPNPIPNPNPNPNLNRTPTSNPIPHPTSNPSMIHLRDNLKKLIGKRKDYVYRRNQG
jgi:hypothetical protein